MSMGTIPLIDKIIKVIAGQFPFVEFSDDEIKNFAIEIIAAMGGELATESPEGDAVTLGSNLSPPPPAICNTCNGIGSMDYERACTMCLGKGKLTKANCMEKSNGRHSEIPVTFGFDKASSRGDVSCLVLRRGKTIELSLYGYDAEAMFDLLQSSQPKSVSVDLEKCAESLRSFWKGIWSKGIYGMGNTPSKSRPRRSKRTRSKV